MSQRTFLGTLQDFFSNYKTIITIYTIVSLLATIQQYFLGKHNNFVIFKHSSFHFFERINMYCAYPEHYFDFFLYNPTFALLFAPYAFLPMLIGMIAWNLTTTAIYFLSIYYLPISKKSKAFVYYFTLMALITSLQHFQTNPLVISFILLAYIYTERDSLISSALYPCLGFFIKAYGAASGVFLLLKRPSFKTILYLSLWFFILLFLPLVWYSPSKFVTMYTQWFERLSFDHSINEGMTIMGMLIHIFKLPVTVTSIQVVGAIILIATIVYLMIARKYETHKYAILGYITSYIIIFNHAAESNTYLIAVTGIAVWFTQSKKTWVEISLLVITFVLSILSSTDLFPRSLREAYVVPYSLKALGPTLVVIWLQIQFILPHKTVSDGKTTFA